MGFKKQMAPSEFHQNTSFPWKESLSLRSFRKFPLPQILPSQSHLPQLGTLYPMPHTLSCPLPPAESSWIGWGRMENYQEPIVFFTMTWGEKRGPGLRESLFWGILTLQALTDSALHSFRFCSLSHHTPSSTFSSHPWTCLRPAPCHRD